MNKDYLPTLSEYMYNPMGKGSSAIQGRDLVRADYIKRLNYLTDIDGRHKKVILKIFKKDNTYIFHFVIPSETERNNTYDVLFQFIPDKKDVIKERKLDKYGVRFFSNSPAFTFTFANVFLNNDILIMDLRKKYDNIVLKEEPVIRNANNIINYEKSIMFAAIYLINKQVSLMDKMYLDRIVERLPSKYYKENIRTTDQINFEIKKENSRLQNERANEKYRNKTIQKKESRNSINIKNNHIIKSSIQKKEKIKPKKKIGRK